MQPSRIKKKHIEEVKERKIFKSINLSLCRKKEVLYENCYKNNIFRVILFVLLFPVLILIKLDSYLENKFVFMGEDNY